MYWFFPISNIEELEKYSENKEKKIYRMKTLEIQE